MMATPLQQLLAAGQSPWYDNIRRELLASGGLQALVDSGIRGVTANPTIFEKAVAAGTDYDEAIRNFAGRGATPHEIYEELLIEDIRSAADILRPIYDATGGLDGYASIEVSPEWAHDTQGSVEEARRYFSAVGRPNVMIKVPATDEGIPAIRQLTVEGYNVNITLIFAVEYYEQVMDAYLDGLEQRLLEGKSLDTVASVASFFVSRIDTEVDKRLASLIEGESSEPRRRELQELLGKAAIANARIAYHRFLARFAGEKYARLKAQGARVQRPLWASTGTKNPDYSDVMYVEELVGPNTVNTMPQATIDAFQDHGRVERTIDRHVDEAYETIAKLEAEGISLREVTDKLQVDGIATFAASLESLKEKIASKAQLLEPARR
jgi:transaldolase